MRLVDAPSPGRRGLPRGPLTVDHQPNDVYLADCGLPHHRRAGLRNDATPWAAFFARLTYPHFDDLHDPAAAAALLQAGYRPSTRTSYISKFSAFVRYCVALGRSPLPATPSTLVGYILW